MMILLDVSAVFDTIDHDNFFNTHFLIRNIGKVEIIDYIMMFVQLLFMHLLVVD